MKLKNFRKLMSEERLPTGKIERASRFLRTGVNMGASYVTHKAATAVGAGSTEEEFQEKLGLELLNGLIKLRGTALKIGQTLSLNDHLLPPAMQKTLAQSQSAVPPMSGPLAIQAFKRSVGLAPDKVFDRFNPEAARAASLGQVHEAWKDGKKYAVKIQYPGVDQTIQQDINMAKSMVRNALRMAPKAVVGFDSNELDPYFQELEARLLEELDYRIELKNTEFFRQGCAPLPAIHIARCLPEYSSDRVLTMEWLDGLSLDDFLATNPDEETRRKAAQNLFDLYEFQLRVLRKMNSDSHPGNFLFYPNGDIAALDFGSVKDVPQVIFQDFVAVAEPDFFEDRARAEAALERLEFIKPTDSPQTRELVYDIASEIIQRLTLPNTQGRFNFHNDDWFKTNMDLLKAMKMKLREPRGHKDLLFVNRSYIGLHHILYRLNAEIITTPRF